MPLTSSRCGGAGLEQGEGQLDHHHHMSVCAQAVLSTWPNYLYRQLCLHRQLPCGGCTPPLAPRPELFRQLPCAGCSPPLAPRPELYRQLPCVRSLTCQQPPGTRDAAPGTGHGSPFGREGPKAPAG